MHHWRPEGTWQVPVARVCGGQGGKQGSGDSLGKRGSGGSLVIGKAITVLAGDKPDSCTGKIILAATWRLDSEGQPGHSDNEQGGRGRWPHGDARGQDRDGRVNSRPLGGEEGRTEDVW